MAPFAALIITYGTRSPTFGAVAASLYSTQQTEIITGIGVRKVFNATRFKIA